VEQNISDEAVGGRALGWCHNPSDHSLTNKKHGKHTQVSEKTIYLYRKREAEWKTD
jgi:hypothetical protein